MNQISVYFDTCSPAPSNGYKVYWRNDTTGGSFNYLGNFFTSPVVFTDDGPGMDYSGLIGSEYSDPNLECTNVPWSTAESGGGGGSGSVGSSQIDWYVNGVLGAELVITDESLANVLDVISTLSPQSGILTNLSGQYTICAKWYSGSGNTIKIRICSSGSEVYYNGSILIGGQGCYTTFALPSIAAPYQVYVMAGNIEPPVCE